jgi:outer membrane lipoprotein carrier protein
MQNSRNRNCGFAHPVRTIRNLVCFCLLLAFPQAVRPAGLQEAVAGLQNRYASVDTVKGSFRQTYRAPGVSQEESGEFWLKKPGLMRWEYRAPEEQLFVADGRESFLYVPKDHQVTIQPFSAADLHSTPLEFLLGSGDINRSFGASWETVLKPSMQGTLMIRLVPRKPDIDYSFLVLEIDSRTFDLRRIAVRDPGGSTTEFFLTNVVTNVKPDKKLFQFKTPKGVEEIRLNEEK